MIFRNSFPKICLSVCVILLNGCATSLNNREPYAQYLKKPLTLQEDARLVMTQAWTGGNFDMIFTSPDDVFALYAVDDPMLAYYKNPTVIDVPRGTELTITRVTKRVYGSGAAIEAIGKITLPDRPEPVPFLYHWAWQCDPLLKRAPWEDGAITAESRPLTFGGCGK